MSGPFSAPIPITPDLLRGWPLPRPDDDGDKDHRGSVLVAGGATEMPGAVILAATATLRAGAGKLQIATVRGVAPLVGAAVPEARVFALPETAEGGIDPAAAEELASRGAAAQAMLIGPGMLDEAGTLELITRLLSLTRAEGPTMVLDAIVLTCGARLRDVVRRFAGQAVLTPHAGEMATMVGADKEAVRADPLVHARRAAAELGAVIALKGAETLVTAPDGAAYQNRSGNVGLATSGSGDTLSGIIAGLCARGADPLQATAWGVYLHGSAGDRLASRVGPLGFLARELLAEVPPLMSELDGRESA